MAKIEVDENDAVFGRAIAARRTEWRNAVRSLGVGQVAHASVDIFRNAENARINSYQLLRSNGWTGRTAIAGGKLHVQRLT